MAQNIDEVYNDLVQDERFKSLYPSQSDFVQYLENEPTADADIEELFGVKSASEYLKKKDQSIIQNLGEENSSLQSLSVGQTEPVLQDPQAMVGQPQEGGDQNLGAVEDPYGLQALGETVWSKQREILESLRENKRTVVPACHAPGKSHNLSHLNSCFIVTFYYKFFIFYTNLNILY